MNKTYIEKMINHLSGESIKVKYNLLKNEAGHTDEEIQLIYPEIKMFSDLIFNPHSVVPSAVESKFDFNNGHFISVIGGGTGLYGDGETTFEVGYVVDGKFEVASYLPIDEITEIMVDIQSKPMIE